MNPSPDGRRDGQQPEDHNPARASADHVETPPLAVHGVNPDAGLTKGDLLGNKYRVAEILRSLAAVARGGSA
jgi:hypothetical protein